MTGEIIAIFAVLTFVVSNVLFRKTEREASPVFINFFRTAIGTFTFIIIAGVLGIFTYIFLVPWILWIILFLSFLFGQVIGDTAYFKAQKELGTTVTLAISMTFPLFTIILSLIFLNHAFEYKMILSIVLTLVLTIAFFRERAIILIPIILLTILFGGLYDILGKRFPHADYFISTSIFLLAIYGGFSVKQDISALVLIICALAFIQMLAQNIVAGLKDVDHDYLAGGISTPLRMGVKIKGKKDAFCNQIHKGISFKKDKR